MYCRTLGNGVVNEDDLTAASVVCSRKQHSVGGYVTDTVRLEVKEDFDIVVADGQNALKGKIFRMGTLGYVCERDVIGAIGALELTLQKLGAKVELGAGVKAFCDSLK